MTAVPNTIALAVIPDGSLEVAVDHRNNYAAIQTQGNGLVADLSGGSAGQVLQALSSSSVGWANLGGLYRKTTAKTVNNTVAETDLLNGEITVGAGVLGTTGMLRCTFFIDALNNSGGAATWQFKVKLGGTSVFDSSALSLPNQGAPRFNLALEFEMLNTGAAATNVCRVRFIVPAASQTNPAIIGAGQPITFGTGEKWSIVEGVGASTIDTSIAKALTVTVTHGTAAATIETKLYGAVVEVI